MRQLVPPFILQQFEAGRDHGRFPAVCLFVDVAGFTPLTQALMAHGPEGAELVADALAEIFPPLLQIVADQGGFVAAFAGDAFKAIFPLDEADPPLAYHRAVAAAWQMRQMMAQPPRRWGPFLVTTIGNFRFTIKAIMAGGSVEWRIWRGEEESDAQNAAYTFAGEALARCMAADPVAVSGEVVLTTAVAQHLPAAVSLAPLGDYWRLDGIDGEWLTSLSSIPAIETATDEANAVHFFPDHLLYTSLRGEFRQVVTLFINLPTLPVDDEFARTLFGLLHRYNGYLCRSGQIGSRDAGGTLLLFWGAPRSSEQDVSRALHFALALQAAIATPLKAGVSTGLAFAGFIGGAQREEYTCYGTRVNLAARQMAAADWGEILLDEATVQRASAAFRLGEARPYQLKGFAEVRHVVRLHGVRHRSGASFYHGRLVGREREMALLETAVQPLQAGQFAGLITVSGEAGLGKSRLVHEFLAGQPHYQVFVCQTDEILCQSLNPFRYWLRHYFGQSAEVGEAANKEQFDEKLAFLINATADAGLRAELRRVRSFLGALVDLHWPDSLYEQVEPQLRFANTLTAVKILVKAESQRQPLILTIEDAHWLEPDSQALLAALTRNVAEFPFLIIATMRPEDEMALPAAEDAPKTSIAITPLGETAVAALAEARLDGPVAPELAALLAARAEGNPFFAEQILLYWQEQGLLARNGHGWELLQSMAGDGALPADVRQVLVARLDRLPPGVRRVVQAAAVLGREFVLPVLVQMLVSETAVPEQVQTAADAAIWSALSELRYLFQHVLLRDAAYTMQLQAQRRLLHRQAMAAIEAKYGADLRPFFAELAHHAEAGGLPEQARDYWEKAGDVAREAYQNSQAAAYYSRALVLTTEPATRYDLLMQCEALHEIQGLRDAQGQDLAALLALAQEMGDVRRQAEVALRRSRYLKIVGEKEEAKVVAETAVALAQRSKSVELEAEANLALAEVLRREGDLAVVGHYLERALRLAQAANAPQVEADTLRQMAQNLYYQGEYQGVFDNCRQVLDIYRQLGDQRGESRVLGNLGLALAHLNEYAQARDFYEQALTLDREIGNLRGESSTFVNLGKIAFERGRYEQAEGYMQQALRLFRETGTRGGESTALINLGELSRTLGDFAGARAFYEQAGSIGRLLGAQGTACTVLNFRGVTLTMEADYEQAKTCHEQALVFCRENGYQAFEGKVLTDLGNALVGLGQFNEAVAAFQEATELRHQFKQRHLFLESQAGLARVALVKGESALALKYVEPILDYLKDHTLDGMEDPFLVYLTCYRVLQVKGDGRANSILSTACHLLHERVVNIQDEALRQSFLENIPANRELWQEFTKAATSE